MINDGKIAAQIGKTLNLSKPHVSYYIRKSKDTGYVKETIHDAITILELTQAGKNFVDQYEKHHQTIPTCRAENIRFKAEVLQMPTIPVDWNRIQMHNWTQYTAVVDNIQVRLNLGKTPSIELIPSPLDGDDYNELIVTLVYDCMGTIRTLEERFGIRVGRLQLSSRGEWIVYDPIAKAYSKHIGQVEYKGVGKVNASAPRRTGEFEFHDPAALVDYLTMPKRVNIIERHLEGLEKSVAQLPKLILDAIKCRESGIALDLGEPNSQSV
jgi:hypothetical protein